MVTLYLNTFIDWTPSIILMYITVPFLVLKHVLFFIKVVHKFYTIIECQWQNHKQRI